MRPVGPRLIYPRPPAAKHAFAAGVIAFKCFDKQKLESVRMAETRIQDESLTRLGRRTS
jgi:hypothetical protein